MNLLLKRKIFTENSTIGELYVPEGDFFCFTLEDCIRDHKIAAETAIPAGIYEVVIAWSNRFQRSMPRLLNVPFYQGILIHNGNTPEQTEGCILVGKKHGENVIYESHATFDELFPKLKKLAEKEKLFLRIEGGYTKEQWRVP